ncbi:hypothetical protein BRO54_1241 [Geobacillus proteiniphilus]|uniref:Uncharacterized protein n=1 Tax=Geobacillus proteiniphilus TaxID=860353 RepID=A0A1Q5T487_9BACL|nr:hypothetical protein BRO54_1241 [Geobacillus proteiniphilus]
MSAKYRCPSSILTKTGANRQRKHTVIYIIHQKTDKYR